jgi:plastocyanin
MLRIQSMLLSLIALVVANSSTGVYSAAASTAPPSHTSIVKIDLDYKPVQTKYGKLQGFDPVVLTLRVGDKAVWQNVDNQVHTATARLFPTDGRIATGSTISQHGWSTGALNTGEKSRAFTAVKPGVYRYQCGYHTSLGQRGVIVGVK